MKRILSFCLAALLCVPAVQADTAPKEASAPQVESGSIYCFSPEDFTGEEPLVGICITALPDAGAGTVMLGKRALRPGDILSADQVAQMTFAPVRTEEDATATVQYLPIYENRVSPATTVTIAIRGKTDKAPVAQDMTLETYKNLPNKAVLKGSDPEGQSLTYTVLRQPRRGNLELAADGSFVYTPKKNKVGVDSFTYTATDPAGNVSREATVTVQILKPTEDARYTDTVDLDCRFEAEWLRNTGLFVGEQIGGENCFQPDKTVSRGAFLTMALEVLGLEPLAEEAVETAAPQWLKPYVAAALRSGLLAGWTDVETLAWDAPITGSEAASLLLSALDFDAGSRDIATWAQTAVTVMNENGFSLPADLLLTRSQMAVTLYQLSKIAPNFPGMTARG